jgi:stress response protein SCP2
MEHRGDNTTGAGSGDDERIRIEFGNIPQHTMELFVTVNIYTSGVTF